MKRSFIIILILAGILYGSTDVMAKKSVRVAIITGGHSFDREAFFAMFERMKGIEYEEIQHPAANSLYGSDQLSNYDVLVFYDMVQEISKEQKTDFIQCLEAGVGMVFMHHALASYQQWDVFHKIIGGTYVLPNEAEDVRSVGVSDYKHDEHVRIAIADKKHPVTEGLHDFELLDEVYINYQVGEHVNPLLKTDHTLSPPVIGWTNTHGNSRIVYIQPGHDRHAFENGDYTRLVQQAIKWVGGR